MYSDPQAVDFYNRGIDLDKLGRYDEAVASYDNVLRINPNDSGAWYNRGTVLGKLGRYNEAIDSFDRALKIKTNDFNAWNNRGTALGKLGRYTEAIASYDQALRIKPGYSSAWYNRGNALGQLGQYAEAVASFDQAIKNRPDHGSAWNNRGIALNKLGRNDEAAASYDKAHEIIPNYSSAWADRESVRSKPGQDIKAVTSIDKALEIVQNENSLQTAIPDLHGGVSSMEHGEIVSENTPPTVTPDLFITLNQVPLAQSVWHKMEVQVTNTGKAHAFSSVLSFSDDFETRLIKPVTVEAGSTTVVEIGIMPKAQGTIPIEITLHYKDESGHDYVTTSELWVEVQPRNFTS